MGHAEVSWMGHAEVSWMGHADEFQRLQDTKCFMVLLLSCCAAFAVLALLLGVFVATNIFIDEEDGHENHDNTTWKYGIGGGGGGTITATTVTNAIKTLARTPVVIVTPPTVPKTPKPSASTPKATPSVTTPTPLTTPPAPTTTKAPPPPPPLTPAKKPSTTTKAPPTTTEPPPTTTEPPPTTTEPPPTTTEPPPTTTEPPPTTTEPPPTTTKPPPTTTKAPPTTTEPPPTTTEPPPTTTEPTPTMTKPPLTTTKPPPTTTNAPPTTPNPPPTTTAPPPTTTKPPPTTTKPPPTTTKPPPTTTKAPPTTTKAPPTTTKPAPTTTKPAPTATKPPPTTLPAAVTTSERPGLRRYFTVCTVSYLDVGLKLPWAGQCDIIFYDSLLLRPEDTFMGTFNNAYLKPIFDAAKKSDVRHNTQFGMSVHAPAINDFSAEVKSDAGKKHYKDHWQHKIYHWGVLNIHHLIVKSNPDILKTALTVLKELKDIATAAGKNASMVVGVSCKAPAGCDKVAEYFKTVYLPDGIVILSHMSFNDNNITGCTILPPSVIEEKRQPLPEMKTLSYLYLMNDAVNTIKHLQRNEGLDTMYAVSATMAGRWYKPRYPGKYQVGEPCKLGDYPQVAHLQTVCENTSLYYTEAFEYSDRYNGGYAYDRDNGFTVSFETRESIAVKFWYLYENTDLLVGVAVYDVNYDAAPLYCALFEWSPWSRLPIIFYSRKLLNVTRSYAPFAATAALDIRKTSSTRQITSPDLHSTRSMALR
ncbi:uncharacterized protein [Dermacentor albipictus]|uniref:uncharacterized protein n=1 Tax=Dermacentor albipictus TaxID=60249 RepID=UPI0038FC177C